MEKIRNLTEATVNLTDQVQNLRNLTNQITLLKDRIVKMAGEFNEIELKTEAAEGRPTGIEVLDEKAGSDRNVTSSQINSHSYVAGAVDQSNIIPFPKSGLFASDNVTAEPPGYRKEQAPVQMPILGMPGESLPNDITDYRPLLQRDGLILLAWDMRITEAGERYTAYWVTSNGIARFFASKAHVSDDFSTARPDHKSYAAEDGIEYFGQETPAYMVHVAPELMMSNPRHGELRQAHIEALKRQGNETNFNYRFLLTAEKKRYPPLRKSIDKNDQRADA